MVGCAHSKYFFGVTSVVGEDGVAESCVGVGFCVGLDWLFCCCCGCCVDFVVGRSVKVCLVSQLEYELFLKNPSLANESNRQRTQTIQYSKKA